MNPFPMKVRRRKRRLFIFRPRSSLLYQISLRWSDDENSGGCLNSQRSTLDFWFFPYQPGVIIAQA